MAGIHRLNFDAPDETRTPDRTRVDVIHAGGTTVARLVLELGWTWAEAIKPLAGTDSCQARHVGIVQSGAMRVTHEDGTEETLQAGDAYVIEPGHQAEVVGDGQFVGYEFAERTAEEYARA